jgi:predicted hotdog family 3-hydroxylacyl-ACP dehydratase
MILSREEIAALIPHAGTMCLLDGVIAWDDAAIRCASARHRASDNPLRHRDRLGALCAVEFAAQAMAVHGRLAGAIGARPRAGYLASLRDVVSTRARLDDVAADLTIEATRLMGDEERVMYAFAVSAEGHPLVTGRATVLLAAAIPA